MSLADVEQIALKLTERDRALLASVLLDSIATDSLDHDTQEFERREREITDGHVAEISHEELMKQVDLKRRI